ncbi:MAG: acyl-CoA dehydratase activase [Bacteroidia bacterium]
MEEYFLGIDIGSSFTKIVVVKEGEVCASEIVKTLNRDKNILRNALSAMHQRFKIAETAATGYGKEYFKEAGVFKTEIQCAAAGLFHLDSGPKTIIDIGGEDIKIIRSGKKGDVDEFYMNSKCASGTGTFITEIAERAEIDLGSMSELASGSALNRELNSFCTVFAKTEIMKWIFEEVPIEDVARGIYVSIVNRVAKLQMDRTLPIYIIGGVIAYHPFLKQIMQEKFKKEVCVPEQPQMVNAQGAAFLAKRHFESKSATAL